VGQEGRILFFVMEYLEGQSLAKVLQHRAPMRPEQRRQSCALWPGRWTRPPVRPWCTGTSSRQTSWSAPRTGDVDRFGIARAAQESRLTTSGAIMGTAGIYVRRSRRAARRQKPRADLYSLGIVAYEMLGRASAL